MPSLRRFLLLALIHHSGGDCVASDGACVASELAHGMSLLQSNIVLTSRLHKVAPHLKVEAISSLKKPLKPMQNWHATARNRYPTIFHGLKTLLVEDHKRKHESSQTSASRTPFKLLSFGCADGSECYALRDYFPNAVIDGVDIAADLIAKNAAANRDPYIAFYDNVDRLSAESYDAILAMGVLTHEGTDPKVVQHLQYDRFVEAVDLLHGLLRTGGYLVVYDADYPLSEHPRYSSYKNMCSEKVLDHLVTAADVSSDKVRDAPEDDRGSRGRCSATNEFCIESGWGRKFNKAGDQVQTQQDQFGPDRNETMMMSHGCKHAGVFFKKLAKGADSQMHSGASGTSSALILVIVAVSSAMMLHC